MALADSFIATLDLGKKTVIIMDYAPAHNSAYFEAVKALWKERNDMPVIQIFPWVWKPKDNGM